MSMDFTLRCNSLKCRKPLAERAVVTTCSHVFCISCSDSLGLSRASGSQRSCPACGTRLSNPDDAVVTHLNPSEDYKTSVLSGLSPSIIMECAGRGLSFYSYQSNQEIIYQEFLAKGLTDKYNMLSGHLDQIINDANSEITTLRNRIAAMNQESEDLQRKLSELKISYSDKSKAHQNSQKAYDKLHKRVMQSDYKIAAANAVDDTLNLSSEPPFIDPHRRSGHSSRQVHFGVRDFDPNYHDEGRNAFPKDLDRRYRRSHSYVTPPLAGRNAGGAPRLSPNYRTQLPETFRTTDKVEPHHHRVSETRAHDPQRPPLGSLPSNSARKPILKNHGMSAAAKVGSYGRS